MVAGTVSLVTLPTHTHPLVQGEYPLGEMLSHYVRSLSPTNGVAPIENHIQSTTLTE